MGAEFLSRTRKTIVKHIDKKRAVLATPDLLTDNPGNQPRCLIASAAPDAVFRHGESLIIEAQGVKLSARRGNNVVASFDSPGSDLVAAVCKSGGVTNGTVQRIHKISGKVEVSIS